MRVQARDGNAGLRETGATHATIRERRGSCDSMFGNGCGYLRQRNVRCHAGIPEVAKDVELACLSGCVEHIPYEPDLVVVPFVCEPHRLFVEWREEHSIGTAGLGMKQCTAKILGRKPTAFQRGRGR